MLVIDRFEGNTAVCSDSQKNTYTAIPADKLPPNAREGDILAFDGERYTIDSRSTQEKKEALGAKMRSLFNR